MKHLRSPALRDDGSKGGHPPELSAPVRLKHYLLELLVGRPLASEAQSERKLGVLEGLPTFGLDGLASSAYGPEAALAMLGAAGLSFIEPVMWVILALLAILFISYWQTIEAYPNAAGSYVVAKENLGVNLGLLAAAALMIDYVLNVAVGISAGVGALVSAVPILQPHILALCLIVLTGITLINLRGTVEPGLLFAIPTYLFIGSFAFLLSLAIARSLASGGHPHPIVAPPRIAPVAAAASLWLLMRGFASGCTAMTGVEAVSNGVSAFREPQVRYAHRTLTAIVVILAILLAGIAYLARTYGISAMDQSRPGYQSVLSQLAGAVVGRGIFYYVSIGSLLAVLILSANTSFADLPRLCSFIAKDRFLPESFAALGRRLVFTVGIVFLASSAGLLLIAFDGITDRLIPLFAIGAFTAFTLSQAGMVVHWLRVHRKAGDLSPLQWLTSHSRMLVNGVGAVTTGAALAVILTAKFVEGAWITVIAAPILIILFKRVRHHYARFEWRTRSVEPINFKNRNSPLVLLPVEEWNRLTAEALSFATQISRDVVAIHLTAVGGSDEEPDLKALMSRWRTEVEEPAVRAGIEPPRLVCVRSKYRRLVEPLLQYIAEVKDCVPDRIVAIIIPEFVKLHWWEHLLHSHRARKLKSMLLKHGGPKLIIVSVPWSMDAAADLKETIDADDGNELAPPERVSPAVKTPIPAP
jgi:amino acid transporter